MERSEIQVNISAARSFPDFAALHPGYLQGRITEAKSGNDYPPGMIGTPYGLIGPRPIDRVRETRRRE